MGVLEKARDRFPDNAKIRYYLGSLYDRNGEANKSLKEMEAILERDPNHADALNYVAYTWTTQGVNLEEAEEYLRRALGLRPDSGYILDSLGWNLFVRGKVKKAIPHLEKAAELNPNEATIIDHLADAYLRANLQNKAVAEYKKAYQIAKDQALKEKIGKKLRTLETELDGNRTDKRSLAGDEKN